MRHIYSKKEFNKIMERERVRSDRSGRKISIITFCATKAHGYKLLQQNLVDLLGRRIRCCDEIGWIDEHRLGVILPETPEEGARKLVDDVCMVVNLRLVQVAYKIISYPSQGYNDTRPSFAQAGKSDRSPASPSMRDGQGPVLAMRIPLLKRALDLLLALTGIIILLPFFLLIAAFIKIVSSGPVFFKQERISCWGKPFICWRFRTMKHNTGNEVHQQPFSNLIHNDIPMKKFDDNDPLIIPFGKIMRKSGLDELPQLINVLRGEMSFIGPRPCIPYEAEQYLNRQHMRFDTPPGLTGLWQVSGKNRTK
jgi:lipopolysaccharide/colanic/teichoic acid biosynthesis glycosyltransferase